MSELSTATTTAGQAYGLAPEGYHLPDALRLGRVRLQVADLERSLAWYGDVLGLRVLERSGDGATLAAHGDDAPLVVLGERRGASPQPHRGRLGLYHFAILLPDRAALGRFVAHLARIAQRQLGDHVEKRHLHAQRLGQHRQLGADVAVADDAQRPAAHLVAAPGRLVPDPVVHPQRLLAQPAGEGDDLAGLNGQRDAGKCGVAAETSGYAAVGRRAGRAR